MTQLKDRLKIARKAARRTQAEVADGVGIKQPTYNQLETGKSQGSKHLVQIADFLGVSATWLATGKGNMSDQAVEDIRLANVHNLLRSHGESAIKHALREIGDPELILEGQISIGSRSARTLEAILELPRGSLNRPGICTESEPPDYLGDFEPAGPEHDVAASHDFIELVKLIKEKIEDGSLDHEHAELLKHNIRVMTRKK